MRTEMTAWKNVDWSQVDTDGNKTIDDKEVIAAQKNFGITIWKDMNETAFNHEKQLNNYVNKYSIGKYIGDRSFKFAKEEEEIIKYGQELDELVNKYACDKRQEHASSLEVAKPINTKFGETETNIADRISYLKQMIAAHASRIFGAKTI